LPPPFKRYAEACRCSFGWRSSANIARLRGVVMYGWPEHVRRAVGVASLLALAALNGCVATERRGTPLYPNPRAPRARAEVALLHGPITMVDGGDVSSRGVSFELLPGCHIVQIGGDVGNFDPQYGGWAASLPALTYAFRMRPGGTYTINLEQVPALGQGPMGRGQIIAREEDAEGRTSIVPIVRSRTQLETCLRWVPD
jgi:hypothetical protein